jgi:hypothetical protein
VKHFGDRSQAVGCARSIRNKLFAFGVSVFIYTANIHARVVFGWSRHHNVFCSGIDMAFSFFLSQEKSGRFHYIFSTNFAPFQVGRIFFGSNADRFSVNNQFAVFYFDRTFELAVNRVVF